MDLDKELSKIKVPESFREPKRTSMFTTYSELNDAVKFERGQKITVSDGERNMLHKAAGMVFAEKETQQKRMAMCLECDEFIKITKQCKQCGCFMVAKTRLKHAECPLSKW